MCSRETEAEEKAAENVGGRGRGRGWGGLEQRCQVSASTCMGKKEDTLYT